MVRRERPEGNRREGYGGKGGWRERGMEVLAGISYRNRRITVITRRKLKQG